jgi:hypothetical protein
MKLIVSEEQLYKHLLKLGNHNWDLETKAKTHEKKQYYYYRKMMIEGIMRFAFGKFDTFPQLDTHMIDLLKKAYK